MTSSTRSKTAYIETNDKGNPCQSLAQLATEVAHSARLNELWNYAGLNSRPAPGRRKVKITITVEEVS